MPREATSKEVATLAGRGLALDNLTKAERMKVYASALSQREPLFDKIKRLLSRG